MNAVIYGYAGSHTPVSWVHGHKVGDKSRGVGDLHVWYIEQRNIWNVICQVKCIPGNKILTKTYRTSHNLEDKKNYNKFNQEAHPEAAAAHGHSTYWITIYILFEGFLLTGTKHLRQREFLTCRKVCSVTFPSRVTFTRWPLGEAGEGVIRNVDWM